MAILKSTREQTRTGTLSDEELWQAFAEGEDSAYTLLYFRYSDRLYAYLKLIIGTGPERQLIDDVFQDTWLRVYRERDRFTIKGTGTFAGWVFRIAHNFAISLLRRSRYTLPIDDLSDELLASQSMVTYPNEPLTDLKSADEVLRLLQETVDSLPVMLKEIYVLSEFEQFSMDRLAETLGISKANAKVRLFRARKLVRSQLLKALGMADSDEDNTSVTVD